MIDSSAILIERQFNTFILIKGRRHADCFRKALIEGFPTSVYCTQGFVTDQGEFLDREQAAIHALNCGQITELKYGGNILYSEDLWE